jgi:hypothetical protein
VKALAQLFSKHSHIESMTSLSHADSETTSASAFWQHYVMAFSEIESEFTNVTDDGQTAVLEWISRGRLAMGLPIEYSGVSILRYERGQIIEFRTYFDSAALIPHLTRTMKNFSESVGAPEIRTDAGS